MNAPYPLGIVPGLSDSDLLRNRCYVGGEWIGAADSIPVVNPATGEAISTVPKLGAEETSSAIEAAHRAFASWSRETAKARAVVLRRWFELIVASQDDLARIMTAEQGKPLAEARGEILYAASFIEWFAEQGKRVDGDVLQSPLPDKRILVFKQPVGVCAAITPWNFPAAMITRKVGPALAAGCTMVVKPATQTPLTALALAVLAERAGLPKGVLSVVTGSARAIGGEMTSNRLVRKITFTGSTEVGKELMAQAAGTMKKLSMELGGNAPFLVFDDADLDQAVAGALASKFRNMGQTCVCANRILVQDGVYDAFADKLASEVAKLKVGNGFEDGVGQGPLIDAHAVEKVEEHVADAVAHGARVKLGGKRHALGRTFFEPTLLTGVTQAMKVAHEETFGPVAPLFRFKTEEEGVALANQTEFGLASYFYARDVARVFRVAERLEAGIVGVNTGIISNEVAPFGGVKESGLGREGSKYGIDDYLEIKAVTLGGL
jgi:succinate-semialdehyde dehydrogenase/glutarate-semialdehyde dehydrogenase